jgi:hypothetical protein
VWGLTGEVERLIIMADLKVKLESYLTKQQFCVAGKIFGVLFPHSGRTLSKGVEKYPNV